MKAFYRIFISVGCVFILILVCANAALLRENRVDGRPYRVEISRLALEIEKKGIENVSMSDCEYVIGVSEYGEGFYNSHSDYAVREIGGRLYRFDYTVSKNDRGAVLMVNVIIAVTAAVVFAVMLYVKIKIIAPFDKLKDVPYELSKGNLTTPMKENKSKLFGKFIWGVDLLRESIEEQKKRELKLQKEKKALLLSLSHDMNTPLSAIKLYAKALSKGLYPDKAKQLDIAENIYTKAEEIENYVNQMITASKEDFLSLEVHIGEFYLSELVSNIKKYYSEKLSVIKTEFTVGDYIDCFIKGNLDRSVEVMQNLMENAIKYGDGKSIALDFGEEENCILITVKNSGNTLDENELPHIFESFWRGSNSTKQSGSGLGLYICRQLMHKMGGEIFAKTDDGFMSVTAVFQKVG